MVLANPREPQVRYIFKGFDVGKFIDVLKLMNIK